MNWFRFKLSEETLKDTLQVGFELLFAVVFIFCIVSIDSIVEAFSKSHYRRNLLKFHN